MQVLGDVRSLGRQSQRCDDLTPLRGTWGSRRDKVQIARVVGTDPDNGDAVPSSGDSLLVHFDRRTNRGRSDRNTPAANTKAYADYLFIFEPPIGTDYRGAWVDSSTFRVDVVAGNPDWALPASLRVRWRVRAHFKNDTHLVCETPRGAPAGFAPFALSLNGVDFHEVRDFL